MSSQVLGAINDAVMVPTVNPTKPMKRDGGKLVAIDSGRQEMADSALHNEC